MGARSSAASIEVSELELVITRIFDAPRELVFRAWSDPAHARHWMGPRGFT
ncbi:MAG: SRPBCC domain-containing protein, partial [Candidatus Binataceae bacterium]